MSPKDKHKNHQHPATQHPTPQKESTSRHVYVEPGVQIDFVKDIREQHEAAQAETASTDKKQLFWTKVGAGLVFVYAAITFWQGYLIRDNFIRDQTPYIWTKPRDPVLKAGEAPQWNIDYSNYGRSPALNVRQCLMGYVNLTGLSFVKTVGPVSINHCTEENAGRLGIRAVTVVPPTYSNWSSMLAGFAPLTQEQVDAVTAAEAGLIILGVFQYEDKFGHTYETGFCYFRYSGGAIGDCEHYNYIKQIK